MSLGWILLIGVLARLGMLALYAGPAQFPDTGTYFALAEQLWNRNFSGYDGFRTPGYPLLLLLGAGKPGIVWLMQSAIGVATTALVYALVARCTQSRWAATVAALAHTLALNHLFLEASLLSESLATFLLTLSFYLVQRSSEKDWPSGALAIAGGVTALAALTRPVSALVGVALAGYTMVAARGRRVAATGAFLICFSVPVVAWCAFNQAMIGQFGMSTLIGLTLTNHSGAFIERAPDDYAILRDIYLAYREKHIAASGTHRMTIFEARQEMKERTGFTDAELSRELARMSVKLFKAYPFDYLRSVAEAWAGFWTVPIPVMDDLLRSPGARLVVGWLSGVQTWFFRIGYVAFLLLSVPILWVALCRKMATDGGWNCAAAIVILVLGMSIAQALLEFGGNGRYAIPTQSLAMAAVIIASTKFLGMRKRSVSSPTGA